MSWRRAVANLAPLMTSSKQDWGTPQAFFDALHAQYQFTIDAAANALNHKLPRWYGPGGEREDATAAPWDRNEVYWCNPSYDNQRAFVRQGYDVMTRGGVAMFLLPARTDTRLFHDFIWDRELRRPYRGVAVDFLKGRLTFEGAPASAPFPSMVVVFDGR